MSDNTDKEFIESLSGSLQELKDNHISILLSLPQKYLRSMTPDQESPANTIFVDYNSEVTEEINRYGDALKAKVINNIENSQPLLLEKLKVKIEERVASFIEPRLYIKRFAILKGAMKSYLEKKGMEFDRSKYNVDSFEAIAATAAEEKCQAVIDSISEELELLVLKSSADPAVQENRAYTKKRLFFLLLGLISVICIAVYFK